MVYRIGLVGTGGIARAHFAGYQAILGERAQVVAGCDPDKAALTAYCDERQIPLRFGDAKSLLAAEAVDVLVLLTPPAVRAEYIYPALEQGVHVLVEKPFGNSYAECLGYVEAAAKSKASLAVSQNLRFYPDIEWAHDKVRSGELGDLTYIAHDHFQWRMQTTGWRREEERLEIAIFSIHLLDRLRWIAGLAPERISAVTRQSWQAAGPQGEVFSDLRIEFEHGVVGHMTSSWYGHEPDCKLRVDGKRGTLVTSRTSATASAARGSIRYQDGSCQQADFFREDAGRKAFGYSLKHFLDAIDKQREPIHSGRDNLQTMIIVDGAYLSAARGGEPVTAAEVRSRLPSERA